MISELEKEFDKYRIFGDKRDFDLIKVYKNTEGENCVIHVNVPYMYPDVQNDLDNKKNLSYDCVKEAIKEFKNVLLNNGSKNVILARVDLTKEYDIDNEALLPMTSYYVIKEARRTDSKRARQLENTMLENMKLITDFRQGRITKKQFNKARQKQMKKVKNI